MTDPSKHRRFAVARLLPTQLLWLVLCLLPFLFLLAVIGRWGVNVIFGDELHFIPIVNMLYGQEPFQWSVLLQQLNEHRPVFPVLLIAALAFFTDWNIKYELFVSPLLAAVNVLLIYAIACRSLPGSSLAARRGLGLITAILSFSLIQWENWYQSISLAFFMVMTAVIMAVWVLNRSRRTWTSLFVAAGLCFLASFSLSHGLLSWIALLPLVVTDQANGLLPQRRHKVAVWLSLFVVTATLFAYNYQGPTKYSYDFSSPLRLMGFFLGFLGAPLSLYLPVAIAVGAVIMILSGFLAVKIISAHLPFKPYLPWLCLWLFVTASATVHAIGRLDFGLEAALNSRYITTATMGIIALMYSFYLYLQQRRTDTRLFTLSLFAIVMASLVLGLLSLEHWQARSALLRQGKACLETYTIASTACLTIGFGGNENIKDYAETLASLGFLNTLKLPSHLAWTIPPNPPVGEAHFQVERLYIVGSGWALEPPCQPAEHVIITYGPQRQLIGHTTSVLRPEDVPPFHSSCSSDSGWQVVIDRQLIPNNFTENLLEAWVYDKTSARAVKLERLSV